MFSNFLLHVFCTVCLSAPILINVQAFLLDNQVVPLSMTQQSLYVTVETQVLIAGLILAGVYVLIIFEVCPFFREMFKVPDL